MPRRRNCSGADVSALATIRGVPEERHGWSRMGTVAHHRGCAKPASSANFSATAASRLSSRALPERGGGSAIPVSSSVGFRTRWSTVARSCVQSISSPEGEGDHAFERPASATRRALVDRRTRRRPLAVRSRSSIVIVASAWPDSTRDTVEVGTPARRANAVRESPARFRASTRSSAAFIGVAYMQHETHRPTLAANTALPA